MKTFFYTLLFCCTVISSSFGQVSMKEDDWNKIITHLSTEEWEKAEKVSLEFLNKFKGEDENSVDAAILRYMYIRCVGANLSENKDKEMALKKVKKFIGKKIITPGIVFKEKGMFNFFNYSEENKNKIGLCASNSTNTSIFTFEHFSFKNPDFIKKRAEFEGKELRFLSEIKSIEANGFALPRLDIEFVNTEIFE